MWLKYRLLVCTVGCAVGTVPAVIPVAVVPAGNNATSGVANSNPSCCGSDCTVRSDTFAPGCSQDHLIHHAGHQVTEADTMRMDSIHQRGYEHMWNASCASGFNNDIQNLSVSTKVYDCGGLCPVADYGDDIFNACCEQCRTEGASQPHEHQGLTYTFCKGCPAWQGQHPPVVESEKQFQFRIHKDITAQVTNMQSTALQVATHHGTHVYGSAHEGAWHTDLDSGMERPIAGGASGTGSLPLYTGSQPVLPPRKLQHMFDNSYGYNTRCAAAVPRPCQGHFMVKLVDCSDCHGVPILQRACCRDCGCELAHEATRHGNVGDFIRIDCNGCSCTTISDRIQEWVQDYVGSCLSACCGADCQVELDSPAPGCNTDHLTHHVVPNGSTGVTVADTMDMNTIHNFGYEEMFNASCASGYDHDRTNLTMRTVIYDCARLCPVEDYGRDIFDACCKECADRELWEAGSASFTFTFCKGCPDRNDPSTTIGRQTFQAHVSQIIHAEAVRFQQHTNTPSTRYGDEVYGSAHDGAWHTDLDSSGHFTHTDALQEARSRTGELPLHHRRLQHMFENSYGYNTRCAAAIHRHCDGAFQVKVVDCTDCHNVPVLQRACCRDCGCELAREAGSGNGGGAGNYLHLQCLGCSCQDVQGSISAWVAHYINDCEPMSEGIDNSLERPDSSPFPDMSAGFSVSGRIPLHFQNMSAVLHDSDAHWRVMEAAIGEAIGEIAQVNVNTSTVDVTLTMEQASRLLQQTLESSLDSQLQLTSVIYANYEITSPDQATADRAEVNIEAETVSRAQTVITRHLNESHIEVPTSIGAFVTTPRLGPGLLLATSTDPAVTVMTATQAPPMATSTDPAVSVRTLNLPAIYAGMSSVSAAPAGPRVMAPAAQASPLPAVTAATAATSMSGAWLPAVLCIAVALVLSTIAIAVFMNSGHTRSAKTPERGLVLSPGPAETPKRGLVLVQPTTSTVLPMANLFQPPVLLQRPQMISAQAVSVAQQPIMPRRR